MVVKVKVELSKGNVGDRARQLGLIPRYLAGGHRNPAKKRQRKNGQ